MGRNGKGVGEYGSLRLPAIALAKVGAGPMRNNLYQFFIKILNFES